jgi:hypothetical protein
MPLRCFNTFIEDVHPGFRFVFLCRTIAQQRPELAGARIGGPDLEAFQAAVGVGQWRNVLGYGMADDLRSTFCDARRAA